MIPSGLEGIGGDRTKAGLGFCVYGCVFVSFCLLCKTMGISVVWCVVILYRLLDFGGCSGSDRVFLDGMGSVTFVEGALTTGRRHSPHPQLVCGGGTAVLKTELFPHQVM